MQKNIKMKILLRHKKILAQFMEIKILQNIVLIVRKSYALIV